MDKRSFIDVDEVAIKRMIAGDMPPYTAKESETMLAGEKNQRHKESIDNTEAPKRSEQAQVNTVITIKEGNSGKTSRKKKTKDDYQKTFLERRRSGNYKQTSLLLEEDIYYSVKKILRIAGDFTITGFINNVLRYHLQEYKEDISEFRKNFIADLHKEEEEEEL